MAPQPPSMADLMPHMIGPQRSSEANRHLLRRPTGDKDRNPESEDEDEEVEDDDDDDDENGQSSPEDPTKSAFSQILARVKAKELKLGKSDDRKAFFSDYGSYLEGHIDDNKNLLHVLAYEASFNSSVKSLIGRLAKRSPSIFPVLVGALDDNDRTPLYVAITKKNIKLVSCLCENLPSIDDVLRKECDRSETCLHAAIRLKLPAEIIISLVSKASENTLCKKDSKGRTPLHLAVEYEKCSSSQLGVVQALIKQGDSALDEETNGPDYFSVFRYHEYTRDKFLKQKDRKAPSRPNEMSNLRPATGAADQKREAQPESKKPKEENKTKDGPVDKNQPVANSKEPRLQMTPGLSLRNDTVLGAIDPERRGDTDARKNQTEELVTKESADLIRDEIKLHYLRTRRPEIATTRLYGKNLEDTTICFEYAGAPTKVDSDDFKESFRNVKFDTILQYVAFPNVEVHPKPALSKSGGDAIEVSGRGRTDMIFFFEWLRNEKGVKRILKVIVDDIQDPAHSDEAIETALEGFDVEVLEWRKVDLCPETICNSSDKLREVYLSWSGNNAMLRAWSEPDGLKKLENLTKVHLHVKQDLETSIRTTRNINNFCERLRTPVPIEYCGTSTVAPSVASEVSEATARKIEVSRIERGRTEQLVAGNPASLPEKPELTLSPHRWLDCMDGFADAIQNIWRAAVKGKTSQSGDINELHRPVEVALIDDGVDVYHEPLRGKISSGKSFDYGDRGENRMRPYWVSERGHGTVMANMICRVCPMVNVYAIRLETQYDGKDPKPRIVARSAAEAIDAAVDRQVQIISMSWTIKQPEKQRDKEKFDAAMRRAVAAGILIFCSAGDAGAHQDSDYPASCSPNKVIRIGAAKANGNAWEWVGSLNNLDFITPGHEVVQRKSEDVLMQHFQPQTGSSVATALAVGLAALIISCVKLGALHTQSVGVSPTAVTMKDLVEVRQHKNMKAAFDAVGTSRESNNKFIEVWRLFEKAAKDIQPPLEKEKRLGIVADLARNFVRTSR
ncbi:hypothetical protein BP5796_09781 [Coleophoma crateriformis]|uniref:Peptidase S8/S53 domain-containing protein n=1 Tax=Coleophoma crateriformis TaxID=565419 RepID=A0A3D8QYZ9_9HELO|nr:hypothetical protein BP5796_09781 [Coleophoma crateriformis]